MVARPSRSPAPSLPQFPEQGGEMGHLVQTFDWATTPLGPIECWPESLRTSLSLILNSRHPMWIGWGPECTFLYNDAYVQVLGAAKHPWALGKPASVVWSEIWDIIGPLVEGVFREGRPSFFDNLRLFMKRADFVEETFYSFSYSPIYDKTGKVGGLFCPSNEVTDKLLNERRLRTLSELAERAYLEKTIDGASRSAAGTIAGNPDDIPFALLYLADGEKAPTALKGAIGVPADGPAAAAAVWPLDRVLSTGEACVVPVPQDLRLPIGLAGQRIAQAIVLPVAAAGQERPAGVLVAGVSPARPLDREYRTFFELVAGQVGTAVRSATVAEEERRRTEALAELDRAKTLFFSNVSHELRTPLTLLLGPVEDALRNPRAPLEGESLDAVHRNGLRLLKLVNTLLDFSRIEAGRLQPSFRRVDLGTLTYEIAGVFRSTIERAGLRFAVDSPPTGADVYVDPSLWEKVVLNLVSNAYKFTLEGKIAVRLSSSADRVRLEVEDTGIGIPEDQMPRLFERFHRVQGAQARSFEGSGIGLALVKELVHLHGGTIDVESREGKGSTFRVSLPRGKAHLPADRVTDQPADAGQPSGGAPFLDEATAWGTLPVDDPPDPAPAVRESARILVADDNADMRAYMERLLRGRWTVEAVADGQKALERVRENPPDLVLSDVMMPRLDGLGLLKAMRAEEQTKTIPVILVSARAGEESRIEGLDWGADDYLIKPFSSQELIARVAAHLNLARLRKESETAVRRSEELLRGALTAARMFAWDLNLETGRVQLSESAASVVGAPRDLPEESGWEHVHPDDAPELRSRMERAAAEAGSFCCQFRLRHFDTGDWVILEARGQGLRDPDGKVRRLVGLVLDVTEREKAAAALRARSEEVIAIMESAPAIIWVAQDPEGRSIVGNRASYDVLRMAPGLNASVTQRESGKPTHFHLVVDGKHLSPEEYPIQRALREGKELRNYEERLVFADGTSVDLMGNVVPLRNPDGSVRGAVAAYLDVTKLKAVEAQIRALNVSLEEKVQERTTRLREALQELETFTYSVAHDLRGPLRAMNQLSEMLIEDYAPTLGREGQDYARRIGQAAERMDHLTRDLLEYSRLARADVAITPVNVRTLVHDVVASLDSDIRQSGARIQVEVGEEVASGNRFLLTRALTNLIGNAIKFTRPESKPHVRIRSGAGEQGTLRLWIEDDGIGIDPAHHPKLFRVFERLDPQGPFSGTGIGLAIARKAVERMNGRIGVESELGKGCRFYVELPEAVKL